MAKMNGPMGSNPAFQSGINPSNPYLQLPQLLSMIGGNQRAIGPSMNFNPPWLNPNAGFSNNPGMGMNPPMGGVPPMNNSNNVGNGMKTIEPVVNQQPAAIAPSNDFLQKIAGGHSHGFMV